jgi:tRNA G10  N-methylase Trm11
MTTGIMLNMLACCRPGETLIDPCCGSGTVLHAALERGIKAKGYDINPLMVEGTNTNLAHFGYPGETVCTCAFIIIIIIVITIIIIITQKCTLRGSVN